MPARVLIVDDDATIQKLIGIMLRPEGYEVHEATDAEAAFRKLGLGDGDGEPLSFDLVLMDIAMPGIDGYEACRRIKAEPRLRDLPVVFVTATDDESYAKAMEAAFAVGATDFVAKPIHRVELLARVRSALRLKQEMERRRAREAELVVAKQALERANEDLKRLASVDALTGLANRRRFDERLEWEWRRAARSESPLAIVLMDIDRFKEYNDALGHPAGDEALRKVAHVLSSTLQRAADLVARYGGEEFVVILAETPPAGAAFVAEQLRARVEQLALPHPSGGVVTISVGVAVLVPRAAWSISYNDLVGSADRALYRAKAAGRNRVEQG